MPNTDKWLSRRPEHKNTPPCGNEDCSASTGIHDGLTFGSGKLDNYGYWEKPCAICARHHENHAPKDGKCWPFK